MVWNVYSPAITVAMAMLMAALLSLAVFRLRPRLSHAGVVAAALLGLLYLALPVQLLGVAYVDVRVFVLTLLVLSALTSFRFTPRSYVVLVAGLLAAASINAFSTLYAWTQRQSDIGAIRASFRLIPSGSTVLIARLDRAPLSDQALFYAPTLAVPEAGAFIYSFYASRGFNPVAPRSAFARFSPGDPLDLAPPTVTQLARGDLPSQLREWRHDFDYLYVMGSSRAVLPEATAVVLGERFTLYRLTAAQSPP